MLHRTINAKIFTLIFYNKNMIILNRFLLYIELNRLRYNFAWLAQNHRRDYVLANQKIEIFI